MSELSDRIGATLEHLGIQFEAIAHNLANAGTVGYKRRISSFTQALAEAGVPMPDAGYDIDATTVYDFSQGPLMESGRPLDAALEGKGFFVIETPDGPLYTRSGAFGLNSDNQIVDLSGRPVAGSRGPISVPAQTAMSAIRITADGAVQADGITIDNFKLVAFKAEDEKALVSVGEGCFRAPGGVRPETPTGLTVRQYCREASNVQLMEEMVNMLMVSRLYQANTRVLSATKDIGGSLMSVAMG
ncbi:MAG TPA: flagellar hook-basal body protein [Phycisphaerales bacterium]|nr:flagellar hook-basal body protein [Phycisphaerales bacterium]